MSIFRISKFIQFNKFNPLIQTINKNGIRYGIYTNRPFQYNNYTTNQLINTTNSIKTVCIPNFSNKQNVSSKYDKYKRNFKYFAYLTTAGCAFTNSSDDSSNKNDEDEDTDENLLTKESSDTDLSTGDPFDDEDVVYYYKNYSYESPSKDNKYYWEIKKFRYPNPKMTKIPKSIESEIDSFFVNPFYGYFKMLKDQVNNVFDNVTPIMSSYDNSNGNGNDNVVKMDPFWVVLSNTPPTTFSNAFMIVCGAVFAMWKLAENSVNSKLSEFMNKHFLASYESFKSKRYHTMLTSAISHSSLVHFGLNCMLFHQLMKTFSNNMAFYSTPNVNTSLQSFVRNIFSSNSRFEPVGKKVLNQKQGRVNTNDIFNVMFLSSLASSLGHIYFYKTPVLGASGGISGLMYLLASTFPNSFFRTVFPLPGLNLSILQIGQIFVATNIYFLMNGRSPNIAWAAHLIGLGAGALYCFFQQYVNKRPGFYNPLSLSAKTAKNQWKRTFQVLCKLDETNGEDSIYKNLEPLITDSIKTISHVNPHVIEYPTTYNGKVFEEYSRIPNLIEETNDSIITIHNNKIIDSNSVNPTSHLAFVRNHYITKSCQIDDNQFGRYYSRLEDWESGSGSNRSDLEQLIEENRTSNGVLLVDFYATWCNPCNKMSKNLEVIKDHYRSDKLVIHTINIDNDRVNTQKYGIFSIPTILLFVNGNLHKKLVGVIEVQELIEVIDSSLESIS